MRCCVRTEAAGCGKMFTKIHIPVSYTSTVLVWRRIRNANTLATSMVTKVDVRYQVPGMVISCTRYR